MEKRDRENVEREREENFQRKSSQALDRYESALRLGVSFPFGLTPFL